ncbi:MAG: hypothetical protein QF847_01490 [Candidatus Marinimicrobia bacterium]|jgi:hypothetical protein|nr:hypothetical protein [Candidatus Neomarinimicrobiota bacterium]MDP6499390.1 hypothetical protein [Candidatus Neomarinimicrobiota bacterium]MDP6612233.1 hypothetical protein [Candidatus Neomarinimicrobiota bacterium]MDP6725908.1 hypothetical protein [Candidatus Neomarinimicrobiota bacterium]|tara:strand:- start:34458 stop:35330 length:873 start_codon:yes stop_codon:yes gene_type:complete
MKKLTLLFILLFLISCEKDDGDSYAKDLIGNWTGYKQNNSYFITSITTQTVTNPYIAGTGSITLDGAEEATLQYIYMYSSHGLTQIAVAQKVFGITSEGNNYILNIYDYGDFGSFSQLFKTSANASDTYEGELEFSVEGQTISVTGGALYHESVDDSVMIVGTLSLVQSEVISGTAVELGNLDWIFENYEFSMNINDDKTFEQIIITITGDTEETSGTWSADSDEITLHYPNYSKTFSYSVSATSLEMTYNNDLCVLTPDECLPQYEFMYGMEAGSLEQVVQIKTTYFSK